MFAHVQTDYTCTPMGLQERRACGERTGCWRTKDDCDALFMIIIFCVYATNYRGIYGLATPVGNTILWLLMVSID